MRKVPANKARPSATAPGAAVEAYLAAVPEPRQTVLRQLHAIIQSAVPPGTSEVISYRMPAFARPKPFFGYAAFKNHLGVFPFSGSFYDGFEKEPKSYSRTKSSLHLPYDRPLPARLLRKMVRARVATLPPARTAKR